MDNFPPRNPANPPNYDVEMVGDENNPEPIDARLRRPLEPLAIFADESEPMDTSRPVAAVAPTIALNVSSGDSELEGPTQQPQPQLPQPKRKESEIKSAYQVEADEEEDSLTMSDPYKGKGFLRLDINKFSEFCRGEPDRQQRMSKSVWVRGLPWKILAIPRSIDRGQQRNSKTLGFFLQCNGGETGEGANWNCVASAALHVMSKKPGQEAHIRRITHTFYPKENDWGYSSFMICDQLANPANGFIDNDTVSLAVYVSAEAPHGVSWDSRKHTGFVGLKNQGATCYMNSILQTLFFTNSLRKAVYQMTISPDEDPESSVALAMQRVFYDLSHSDKPVGTKKLTKSFGWDSLDSFLQHDVQELCRVLLDNLETKMKGTPVQDMIPTLFKGKMCSYIKCTDVDYESARDEIFYDVQLNIRSRDPSRHNTSFSIMDSFRDYVEAERLDGENKYDAGEYGLQPALKGVRFVHFPPILQFQLMRFQFDPNLESNVKVNDRFEFTDLLDLNEFVEKNDEGIDYTYYLHAVLVHSGDFHGGHYVVYINTNVKGRTSHWCKFDDDVVSRSTFKDAIVANFGGDDPEVLGRIFTNAYMLVYIRKDKIDEVLCEVTDKDIPPELIERFEVDKIEEERHKKEKQDAHLYQNVYFLTDELIEKHRGFDLFDVKSLDTPEIHRKIEKAAPLEKLFSFVQNNVLNGEDGMGEDLSFRLWRFSESTVRDDRAHVISLARFRATEAVVLNEETAKREIVTSLQSEKAIIYIERPSLRPDGSLSLLPYNDSSDILVFLKFYDSEAREMRCIGTTIVNFRASLLEMQPEILVKLDLPSDTRLRFYEEISPEKVRPIESPSLPLCSEMMLSEVNDGAIIIFEMVEKTTMNDNVMTYINKLYNTLEVEILQNDDQSSFPCAIMDATAVNTTGTVDLMWRCDKLTDYVAEKLNYDPSRLMLWRLAAYSEKPTHYVNEAQLKHSNFRVRELLSLTGDAIHDPRKQKKYKIFYNKIPIPVAELDRRKQMRITMVDEKFNCVDATVFPDKYGNVKSILDEAKRIFKFSQNGSRKLRLVLVGSTPSNKRAVAIFHEEEPLTAVQKSSAAAFHLRVEEIPHDQLTRTANEFLLSVAHFDRSPQDRMFGVPFYIKVADGEPFQQVRERIRQRLELSEKDIEKYKFAILAGSRVNRYLDMETDERVRLADLQHFPRAGVMDIRGVSNSIWLGLDHFNRARGSEKTRSEKAIVIHN
ncbi:hypothetical protein PMAYCL1PPCAC_30845 [Pristionchus mayeri]|uniref:Ubiquitin carboxyl-terminal hydrolase 7 n=1 Tax=Pristionchus mayeri TaxID=1317129 RepID=A0AAN5DDF7_9BILA|nr:hypothetical protein PMAYCL1PPCAC_30845 [Pristionchus mayeri]